MCENKKCNDMPIGIIIGLFIALIITIIEHLVQK